MAPVLAIFCVFGLPIVAYIVTKTLAHNERMEMIRMGYFSGGYPYAGTGPAVPNPVPARPDPSRSRPGSAKIVVLPPLRSAAPGATITPVRTVLEANRREN
jgi:hypothetical protein